MANETIFKNGALWSRSELDMINKCLIAIGEIPYDDTVLIKDIRIGTDGDIARRIIQDTMIEVQGIGWYFNTDYNFKLVPDVNSFISVPPNTLRVDFGEGSGSNNYNIKEGAVYDYKNQTYKIDRKELYADMIWLVDYKDLPAEAYLYIASRAAKRFQERVISSVEIDGFTARDELESLSMLQRRQLQSQDYDIQNRRVSTRIHNGYLISGLFGNKGRR